MQEAKSPKKPLLYYYCIAMLVLLVLNAFLFPRLMSAQVEEVGYNTFLEMMEKKEIAQVQIESNQIVFADKNSPTGFYKQALWKILPLWTGFMHPAPPSVRKL